MKHDIGANNVMYVIDDQNLIYEVKEYETFADRDYIQWNLNLVLGTYNYVDLNKSKRIGFVLAHYHKEELQHKQINQYICRESLKDCLEMLGLRVLSSKDLTPYLLSAIDKSKKAAKL